MEKLSSPKLLQNELQIDGNKKPQPMKSVEVRVNMLDEESSQNDLDK